MSSENQGHLKRPISSLHPFSDLLSTKEDEEKCKESDLRFLHKVQKHKRELMIGS